MGFFDGVWHFMNPGNRGGVDTTHPGTVNPPTPAPPAGPPDRPATDWSKYQSKNVPGGGSDGGWSIPNYEDVTRAQSNYYDEHPAPPSDDGALARYLNFAKPFMADALLDKSARQRMLDRQRGNTSAQSGLFDAQGNDLQSQYDLSNRDADLRLKAQGIDRTQLDAEMAALGPQRDLASSILGNQLKGFQLTDEDTRRKIASQSASAGTFGFAGPASDTRSSHQNLLNQTEGANLGYQGKLLDLDARRQDIQSREDKLGLIADQVGIDRDKAREALDFGLKQLGYDRYISSNKLLDAIDSTSVAERQAAQAVTLRVTEMFKAVDGGTMGDHYQQQTQPGG